MSIADTTALANALQSSFQPGFTDALFNNNELLSTLRQYGMVDVRGTGTSYNWDVRNTKNTSAAVYSENDAAPTAVAQGYAQASLNWVYIWIWIQVTGHARDAFRANPDAIFDAVAAEFELGMVDLVDLQQTTFLGSTNNGLDNAVDEAATYAGIARGSAAYFESVVDSTAAAMTLARMNTQMLTQRAPEKGGKPTLHLCSDDQELAYSDIKGAPGAANNSVRMQLPQDGSAPKFDLGYDIGGLSFYNAPVKSMPDMDDDLWYSLDFRAQNIKFATIRDMETKFHRNSGDSEIYNITHGSTLVVGNPVWQAKHEDLT